MSRDSRERLAKRMTKLYRVIDAIEHTPTRRKLDELHTQMRTIIASSPMTYDEDQNRETQP